MTAQILLLAAGASSRMRGGDKLMEMHDGVPQIVHAAREALATGHPVTVVLAPDRPTRAAALQGLPVRIVIAPRAREGMAESLKDGLAALPDGAVLLCLADMPDLTTADLCVILAEGKAHPDAIIRGATDDRQPGHPVLLPGWARVEAATLAGDEGARAILTRHAAGVRLVPLPGRHALTDLDTPEDWARWRAGR